MAKRRRIGILGGTFNPIHLGHLLLAEQTRGVLGLEKVIFVPANLPPHKSQAPLAPAQQRYKMVALAVESHPGFEVSDLEIKRSGVSYSVETVAAFQSLFRLRNLYFIVGSDFLRELSGWKDLDKIAKICKFIVAQRPGYPLPGIPPAKTISKRLSQKLREIHINALDISSTDIRRRIKTGQTIRYLVPESVRKYISSKGLYR